MELQKVAFRADDDDGPVRQSLRSFATELGTVVDKQLKVFLYILGSVRMDMLRFLARCKSRLNQALSVLSLTLGLFCMCLSCC